MERKTLCASAGPWAGWLADRLMNCKWTFISESLGILENALGVPFWGELLGFQV